MNLQKYTQKSIEALRAAQSDATERGNSRIEPAHVLLALIRQEGGLIPELIKKMGASPETAATALEAALSKLPRSRRRERLHLPSLRGGAERRRERSRRYARRVCLGRTRYARSV